MKAQIVIPTIEALHKAAELLRRSEVVGMPTETVYGLAGIATDDKALTRIFSAKERPTFDPLIVHVAPPTRGFPSFDDIRLIVDEKKITRDAHNTAGKLMAQFWPGPLTIILPKSSRIPDLVTSGLDTVAIRMPRHPIAQALIREAGAPLAAPSANRFGRISPTCAEDVASELGDRIPLIIDGGSCEVGLESTVVRVDEDGQVHLLRPGGTPREAIEAVLHHPLILSGSSSSNPAGNPSGKYVSPGMTASHYAPVKPLELLPAEVSRLKAQDFASLSHLRGERVALLTIFSDPEAAALTLAKNAGVEIVESLALSQLKNWPQAARSLFSSLRKLDASNATRILAEPCEETSGLGHGIADRLRRASATRD